MFTIRRFGHLLQFGCCVTLLLLLAPVHAAGEAFAGIPSLRMPAWGNVAAGQLDDDPQDEFALVTTTALYVGDADDNGTYRWLYVAGASYGTIRILDLNKDGRNDIMTFSQMRIAVYFNTGHLTFGPPVVSIASFPDTASSSVVCSRPGDVDWNGSAVMACTMPGKIGLLTIDRRGNAATISVRAASPGGSGPIIGDFDSDGINDIFASTPGFAPTGFLYRSPAPGVPGEPQEISPSLPSWVVGTLRAEGVEDRILCADGSVCRIRNGRLSCSSAGTTALYATMDANHDGTTDIIRSTYQSVEILLGERGTFSSAGLATPTLGATLTGNFNTDDALDFAFFKDDEILLVCRIARTGTFATGSMCDPTTAVYGSTHWAAGTRIADVNGDGHLDLLSPGDSWFQVRYGNGRGGFGHPRHITLPGQMHARWLLPIQDGLSIRYLRESSLSSTVILDSNFNVAQQLNFSPAFPDGDYRTVDVNGDGLTDVFVWSAGSDTVKVATQLPDHTFVVSSTVVQTDRSIELGDIDGDKRLEIIALSPARSEVFVFSGSGDGTFPNLLRVSVPHARWVLPADVDGDGRSEVLVSADRMYLVRWTAAGARVDPFTALPLNPKPQAVDLNADGRSDLVYAENVWGQPAKFVYYVDIAKGYSPGTTVRLPSVGSIVFRDLNEDGRLDFVNELVEAIQIILNGNESAGPVRTRGARK